MVFIYHESLVTFVFDFQNTQDESYPLVENGPVEEAFVTPVRCAWVEDVDEAGVQNHSRFRIGIF